MHMIDYVYFAVSYITKLLNWKQITTTVLVASSVHGCFLYHKVTKLKANHNLQLPFLSSCFAVSYITKLLNWKQITTTVLVASSVHGCFLYHKVTKLKANHNLQLPFLSSCFAVSYITKLLNWKQITTTFSNPPTICCCFLYHKVTKLKANHNWIAQVKYRYTLFPISQSY